MSEKKIFNIFSIAQEYRTKYFSSKVFFFVQIYICNIYNTSDDDQWTMPN